VRHTPEGRNNRRFAGLNRIRNEVPFMEPQTMQITQNPLRALSRAASLALFAGAATLGVHAQQASGSGTHGISFAQPSVSTSLLALNTAPAASDAPNAIGYSSSAGADATASATTYMSSSLAANPASANPAPQPPPRYGRRPVYADSSHNADGSSKYTFMAGVGLTVPVGGTHAYLTPSYAFQFGGGRNFNKKFALLAQFDWHNFGFQNSTLNDQEALYNLEIDAYNLANPSNPVSPLTQVGGTSHVWSFTLDPMYTYMDRDRFGGYVVGGVGFYHKTANFTTPGVGTYCDPYYGVCYEYQANQTIDKYTSNAAGFNGGFGFTYKASRFSDLKLYAEARYVYIDNSPRQGYTLTNQATTTYSGNNAFPLNSAKTSYIPITLGIRF